MQDTIQVFLFNRVWVNQQKSANTAKVGKTPEGFKLYQHKRGHQPILIGPNQVVNLREPGVERFTTMPKDTTEGRAGTCLRQGFRLPESDEAYLHGLGLTWEALLEGASRWLIIHEWTIPAGYNQGQVSLALLIPANYSDSQIDMVYFKQHLARTDGRPIGTWAREAVRGSKLKPTLSDSRISCGVDFGDLLKLISCGKGSRFRICDMRHASVRGNGASLESD